MADVHISAPKKEAFLDLSGKTQGVYLVRAVSGQGQVLWQAFVTMV